MESRTKVVKIYEFHVCFVIKKENLKNRREATPPPHSVIRFTICEVMKFFQNPRIFRINHKSNSMPSSVKIRIIRTMPVIMESLKRQAAKMAIIVSATM
jgi:hypothetical protein